MLNHNYFIHKTVRNFYSLTLRLHLHALIEVRCNLYSLTLRPHHPLINLRGSLRLRGHLELRVRFVRHPVKIKRYTALCSTEI
jgi:hypothetical protein